MCVLTVRCPSDSACVMVWTEEHLNKVIVTVMYRNVIGHWPFALPENESMENFTFFKMIMLCAEITLTLFLA